MKCKDCKDPYPFNNEKLGHIFVFDDEDIDSAIYKVVGISWIQENSNKSSFEILSHFFTIIMDVFLDDKLVTVLLTSLCTLTCYMAWTFRKPWICIPWTMVHFLLLGLFLEMILLLMVALENF